MDEHEHFERHTGRFTSAELAQFLASSWVLSGQDRRMISGNGVVDKALFQMMEAGALPAQVERELDFAHTP